MKFGPKYHTSSSSLDNLEARLQREGNGHTATRSEAKIVSWTGEAKIRNRWSEAGHGRLT